MSDPEDLVARMARSLDPQDREAALAAVAAMQVELRGKGSVHRAIEEAWRRFWLPPETPRAELKATHVRMRRHATIEG